MTYYKPEYWKAASKVRSRLDRCGGDQFVLVSEAATASGLDNSLLGECVDYQKDYYAKKEQEPSFQPRSLSDIFGIKENDPDGMLPDEEPKETARFKLRRSWAVFNGLVELGLFTVRKQGRSTFFKKEEINDWLALDKQARLLRIQTATRLRAKRITLQIVHTPQGLKAVRLGDLCRKLGIPQELLRDKVYFHLKKKSPKLWRRSDTLLSHNDIVRLAKQLEDLTGEPEDIEKIAEALADRQENLFSFWSRFVKRLGESFDAHK